MAKILRFSYTEFLNIPTYARKFLINKIIEENTPKN
jgi:hypothetical protein